MNKKINILDIKKYKFLSKTPIDKQFEITILNKVLNSSEKNTVKIPILDKPYAEKVFNNFYKCTNIKIYKRCYYSKILEPYEVIRLLDNSPTRKIK
jgi:hypothetical protein